MDDKEFYWDWIKHEDKLFTSRCNFFLVAESMFFAALAVLIANKDPSSKAPQVILCLAGLLVTLIWLCVDLIHFITQKVIRQKLEIEPRWLEVKKFREECIPIPIHFFIGVVLPGVLLIVWILLF